MLNYTVLEVSGKQYKVVPNTPFLIDYQGEKIDNIEANVLLAVSDNKFQLGKPFLKDKITLKVIENVKGEKIRVSKFHAKANYRRTTGIRPKFTKVILSVKKAS